MSEQAVEQPLVKAGETDGEKTWNLAQRRAKALASSSLVPETYRNNVPNVLVALDMADRLRANPLMVMQNLAIISGRPSWSATFLVATVNQCGRFTPLRYETRGDDPRKADFRCRAVARDVATGDVCEGEWIDWPMVEGEGWSKKAGSKWRTMPGQMFRYRAASFWARTFAPEVSMGIYTEDEVRDVIDVSVHEPAPATQSPSKGVAALKAHLGLAKPDAQETPETAPGAAEVPRAGVDPSEADSGAHSEDLAHCPKCGLVLEAEIAQAVLAKGDCPACTKAA